MAAKLKVDQIESVDGSSNITLNQSITMASGKTLPAASLTGTLPAISATNLTNVPAANITGTMPAIDGSNLTGIGGGKILQVKYTYWKPSSNFGLSNNTHISDMDIAITPTSSSSRLMHFINFGMLRQSGSDNYVEFFLYENNGSSSTRIDGGDYGLGYTNYNGTYMVQNYKPHAYHFNSASSSTSARTYEIKVGNDSGWAVHNGAVNYYTIMEYEV